MKIKIYKDHEWLFMCINGEAYEDMLTNGTKNLIAIECSNPECKAKTCDYTHGKKYRITKCDVCLNFSLRLVGKIREANG